jgi:hypothetical protein
MNDYYKVGDPLMGYYINKFVGYFLRELSNNNTTTNSNIKKKEDQQDRFAWIASVLTNITKVSLNSVSGSLFYNKLEKCCSLSKLLT